MNARQASLHALDRVAEGLRELCHEVAFVGGATLALYIDDVAATDVRTTDDVDCVVEAASRLAMNQIEKQLRRLGFEHHPQEHVICRWLFQKDLIVDVMPTGAGIFGFTNRWYSSGLKRKQIRILPGGRQIFVFPFPYFFASKLEAFGQRGGLAWDSSKDLEDIVSVLDGRVGALGELVAAPQDVRH